MKLSTGRNSYLARRADTLYDCVEESRAKHSPMKQGDLFEPDAQPVLFEEERPPILYRADPGKVRAKLENPSFAGKVPAAVLEEHRQRELAWSEKLAQFQRMLDALS